MVRNIGTLLTPRYSLFRVPLDHKHLDGIRLSNLIKRHFHHISPTHRLLSSGTPQNSKDMKCITKSNSLWNIFMQFTYCLLNLFVRGKKNYNNGFSINGKIARK